MTSSAQYVVYDHRLLAQVLGIPADHVEFLAALFDEHVREHRIALGGSRQTVAAIRDFLHTYKMVYRKHIDGSVLGQRGCFPFSVRSAVLAGLRGIRSGLAHSTGMRLIHVMLVDERGVPFDSRELQKGGVVPMSLRDVRFYHRYVLSALTAYHAVCRHCRLLLA